MPAPFNAYVTSEASDRPRYMSRAMAALVMAVEDGHLTPSEATELGKLVDGFTRAIEVAQVLVDAPFLVEGPITSDCIENANRLPILILNHNLGNSLPGVGKFRDCVSTEYQALADPPGDALDGPIFLEKILADANAR